MLLTTGERVNSDTLPYGKVTGDWSNDQVFVIGGGPSLEGFNFDVLDGYKVGANKSGIVANCDAMFSMDWKFNFEAHDDIMNFDGEYYFATMTKHMAKFNPKAVYLKACREGSLSTNPEMVVGLNSGYGSLNIAILKKAKKVRLLGFDMKLGPKKHFHGGYPWDTSKGGSYHSWSRRFKYAKTKLSELGVEVINYIGPNGSGLEPYFESRPLSELDRNYRR